MEIFKISSDPSGSCDKSYRRVRDGDVHSNQLHLGKQILILFHILVHSTTLVENTHCKCLLYISTKNIINIILYMGRGGGDDIS